MTKSAFIKNGKFIIVQQDKFEPVEKFNERGWFIANNMPKTKNEYIATVLLSRIESNKKIYGCSYAPIKK